jgi:arsenate reductase
VRRVVRRPARVKRVSLAIAALAVALFSSAATRAGDEILMVCEHGNVKSLMAASYFNELASARHLPFHAIARGTAPNSSTVPPPIIEGLRSDGFDVAGFHPAAVSAAEVAAAKRVILINTELAANLAVGSRPPEKWADVPAASVDYGAAREALKAHVRALLDQLAASESR